VADLLEVVLDHEVVEGIIAREHLFEELAQTGNVPLAVAELVDEPPLGGGRVDLERGVEGLVGRPHP
jgi:hypothetical protein